MDLVKLREALLISSGASDALKNWENVSFLWALKDMQIVARMADKAGLSMPIAGAIKELVKDGRRIKRRTRRTGRATAASRSIEAGVADDGIPPRLGRRREGAAVTYGKRRRMRCGHLSPRRDDAIPRDDNATAGFRRG